MPWCSVRNVEGLPTVMTTSTPVFRPRYDTLDYGDRTERTLPLLLLKRRIRPMPAIVDKRGLVTMYGRATTTSVSRVPRLSSLVRVERERKTSARGTRRRFAAALSFVFLVGLLVGVALRCASLPAVAGLFPGLLP